MNVDSIYQKQLIQIGKEYASAVDTNIERDVIADSTSSSTSSSSSPPPLIPSTTSTTTIASSLNLNQNNTNEKS